MPRPTIIPELTARLEAYLERLVVEFAATGEAALPLTTDRKVNIAALVTA